MTDLSALPGYTVANGTPAEKYPVLVEIGTTGTPIYAGRVDDEFLPLLRGDRGRKIFREMSDNDSVVGSFLYGIEQSIRGLSFEWEPAEGDHSTEYADFFNGCMTDMSSPWSEVLSGIVRGELVYGWSLNNIVYKKRLGADQRDSSKRSKYDDGRYGWRKFALRTQETRLRWETDPDGSGGVIGMWQQAPPNWQAKYIPLERALLFRTTTARGNPEGRGALRNAVVSWFLKKHIERVEGIGIERELAGLPVVWVDAEWMDGNAPAGARQFIAQAARMITNIRRDEQEGLVMPLAYDEKGNQRIKLELLNSGGTRQIDISGTIARHNQNMAMTVLADFILLGHENVGSLALSTSKMDMFSASLQSLADGIAAVMTSYAAPRLMGLNGWDKKLTPVFKAGKVAKPDVEKLGKFIQAIGAAGAPLFGDPSDDKLRSALLHAADMPDDAPVDVAGEPLVLHPSAEMLAAQAPDDPEVPAAGVPSAQEAADAGVTKPGVVVKAESAPPLVVHVHNEVQSSLPPDVNVYSQHDHQIDVYPQIDVEAAQAPDVHVDVAAPEVRVDVAAPEVTVNPTFNVPEQAAPDVHVHPTVTAPDVTVHPPEVTVNVEAPQVTVEAPSRGPVTARRNSDGSVTVEDG